MNISRKFLLLSFFPFIFFSCNNSSDADQQKKIDSMFPQQNPSSNVSTKDSSNEDSSDEKTEKPFHLSPKDSARVADSVYRTKNGVRDFN